MASYVLVIEELFLGVEPLVTCHDKVVCAVAGLKSAEEDVILLELVGAYLAKRLAAEATHGTLAHLEIVSAASHDLRVLGVGLVLGHVELLLEIRLHFGG